MENIQEKQTYSMPRIGDKAPGFYSQNNQR